ncbi:adenosylcobinamide-GDP ribazoletransferase [Rhodanobacter aciditrophus]|uniref:Adenosylcobinamide-GDP ribazoletransferase n=1 Tax=Rhodanobacter aciditrophus TaxID=1623218 RepID=A0ABW4B581_9GAMM
MSPKWVEDWQGFTRSLATYTRLPVKVDWDRTEKHTPSVCFLPWVGLVVALLSAWPLLFSGWSAGFQGILMLLSAVLLTGAFHEDGLMDAADGLVGGWTPEQRLTIMKDSRVGSYGVLAGFFSLALKWWLVSIWLSQGSTTTQLAGWLMVHLGARWLPLVLMQSLTYVSAGQSKAQAMIDELGRRGWVWLLVSLVLAWALVGLWDLTQVLFALGVLGVAIRRYLKARIGGFNGDTLGASEQLAELLILFVLLGWSA